MRIDTHIHLYDPAMGNYSWPPVGSEFHRLICMDDYAQAFGSNDCHAIVVGCSSEFELNEKLCALVQSDSRLAAYVAQFDPSDPEMPNYARKLAAYPAYRGFRIAADQAIQYPQRLIDAWIPGTVIEFLGNYAITAQSFDLMAAHPEITFVVQHFGAYLFKGQPVPPEYAPICQKLASLPNVVIKVSGMFTLCQIPGKPRDIEIYYDAFKTVLDAFGTDRCMYGSDWPVLGVPLLDCDRVTEEIIRRACGEAAIAPVMGDNTARIYNID